MNAEAIAHETYFQRLWRHFHADPFARNGLRMVIVLFVIASLAPFIANSHALIRVVDGHVTFPIFLSLEPIEWRFLLYLPLAAIIYFLRRRFMKHLRFSVIVVIGLVVFLEIVLALSHPINDPTNDRDRAASFKLLPLIPYSPH